MKKFVKILAVVMVFAMTATLFCACGEKPAPEEPASGESAPAAEVKTLSMGSSCDFPPYEFVDDDGNYAGIDIDIATGFCEKNGYKLEVKDMEFKSIIAAVNSGAVDFGMSGFTITEERKQSINFSDPYEETVQAIVVKEGSPIKGKDDLAGKSIGVQAGTTGDDFVTNDFGKEAVKQYDKYSLAITALINDQVDCVVLDDAPAKEFVKASAGLVKLDTEYGKEQYAAAFNFEDAELLAQFNQYLSEIKADGTLDSIFAKYEDAE